jgi:vesicle-fusing ATPase
MQDFRNAMLLNAPAFGVDDKSLDNCIRDNIYDHGVRFQSVYSTIEDLIETVKVSDTPLLSVLLEGMNGCGKTALAAHLASKSEFSFVKLITP